MPHHSLLSSLRAGEWWEHKLVCIIAMFYATALMHEAPLVSLWPSLLTVLLALVPGAAYVSLINDFTDRAEDLAAGKANRMVGRSPGVICALIAAPVVSGLVFVALWHRDPLLLWLYGAAWLSFTLYSIAPFRLKTRGLAGVFADAAGAHLFPTLLAVVLAFRAIGHPVDWLWFGTVAIWAFAYGLRGILSHQLKDIESDRCAGVQTFAQRHSTRTIEALAAFGIFPVELIGFVCILWHLGSLLPVALLMLYISMVVGMVHWFSRHATIIGTPPRFMMVMQEYYDVFFPLAVLLAASLHHGNDLIILGAHLLLFPRRAMYTTAKLGRLLSRAVVEAYLLLQRARLQVLHRR